MYFVDVSAFREGIILRMAMVCRADVRAGRLGVSALQCAGRPQCRDARIVSGNEGYITSTTVCELLRKIAAESVHTPITLVLDNTRYQRCRRVQDLAAELEIELLFLPPYSPNLNLIERLWEFVKKTALSSRRHASFTDFRFAIDDCLDRLTAEHQSALDTLVTHNFQTFEKVPILNA